MTKPFLDPIAEAFFQSLPEGAEDEFGYMAARKMYEEANARRNAKAEADAKAKADEEAFSISAK